MKSRRYELHSAILGGVMLACTAADAADLPAAPAAVAAATFGPDWGRFYLSARGGAAFLQDTSIDYVNGALPSRGLSLNTGWAALGAAGWQATPWLRTEIEVGRRSNDVGSISPGAAASGSVSATTLMLNAYLDIPNRSPVTPFIGAGFGKAWISHSLTVDGGILSDTTTWPWAYQVIGGARAPLASNWSMSLEYRYLTTQRGLFQDSQTLFYNSDYNSHAVLVGVSWRPL
jgi:opacity protein-like surface antigen